MYTPRIPPQIPKTTFVTSSSAFISSGSMNMLLHTSRYSFFFTFTIVTPIRRSFSSSSISSSSSPWFSSFTTNTRILHEYPTYRYRNFSILSQHQKGLDHLKRLPQQKSNNATVPPPPITIKSSSLPSTPLPFLTNPIQNEPTTTTTTNKDNNNETVVTTVSTTLSPNNENNKQELIPHTPEPSSLDISQQVIRDLEQQGALHDSTMEIMEKSPEWQDYDAHVNYELNMVRARYAAAKEPLNGARRAQLTAHLRATQEEVMEAHADAAVEQLLATLSPTEIDQLRTKLRHIDASIPVTNEEYYGQQKTKEGNTRTNSIFDKEFHSALQDLSSFLSTVQNAPKSPFKKK